MKQSFNMIDSFIQELKKEDACTHDHEQGMREYLSKIGKEFIELFYFSKMWVFNTYKGISTYKFPTDSWILQEIISEIQPDLFIECGTFKGGTTLFIADLLTHGEVVSIDITKDENFPKHDRITYITGDSTSDDVVAQVAEMARDKKVVMVDLDSYHTKDHVAKELKLYSPFVTPGSYLIVEDTVISGHPIQVKNGDGKFVNPGPYEAVMDFLKLDTKGFKIDRSKMRFLLTTNPDGYLRRSLEV